MHSSYSGTGLVMPSVEPSQESAAPTGTVSRALRMLTLLADAETPVTIKQVATQMGLAPSTAHRLLGLLKEEGFVVDVPQTRSYAIGPQFYRVSARVLNSTKHMEFIQKILENICRTYNETVLFGQYIPTSGSLSFDCRRDGQQNLLYQIEMHKPLSLVWGASGKAILAYLPEHIAADILAREGNAPGNNLPPPDWLTLRQQLLDIKRTGYCVSHGEKLPGSRGIAVPVFDRSGVIGSICLTAPQTRQLNADIHEIGQNLAKQARQLSHDLGAEQ